MKTMYKYVVIFLVILAIIISCNMTRAYSGELDPDSLISFPTFIENGQGTIKIDEQETGYRLYYQVIELQDEIYQQMQDIQEQGEADLEELQNEFTQLGTERDNLLTIYEEATETYKDLIDSEVEGTELENAKQEYETAKKNYEDKLTEYRNKANEITEKYEDVETQLNNLIPTYNDQNWTEIADGNFSIDLNSFSGEKTCVVWARLVTSSNNTIYDAGIYTMNGNQADNIELESININESSVTIKKGGSYSLTITFTPANASDRNVVWSSENENIATVSSNGTITARNVGTTRIIATTRDGRLSDYCTVTVTQNQASNISNNGNSQDNTISNMNSLPKAGNTSLIIVASVLIISIVSIILFKKIKEYKNV